MIPQEPPLSFLAAGDLHTGSIPTDRLEALFAAAARVPEARFLAVPGDLTNDGRADQYALLKPRLESLPFPFYGTMGNHDAHAGPDAASRARFCRALGVEAPSYRREFAGVPFLFLSTDGFVNGARVEIERSLGLLADVLGDGSGPALLFCHAPLTGTVQCAPGRDCFSSDHPAFGLPQSDGVRALVRRSGRPVVWICGHTHTPIEAETLVFTEHQDGATLHSVNLSSPIFTGRDLRRDTPVHLFHFRLEADFLHIRIEDVGRGETVREERLPMG